MKILKHVFLRILSCSGVLRGVLPMNILLQWNIQDSTRESNAAETMVNPVSWPSFGRNCSLLGIVEIKGFVDCSDRQFPIFFFDYTGYTVFGSADHLNINIFG